MEKVACYLNITKCALNQCGSCSSNNFDFSLEKDHVNSIPESKEETDSNEVKYFSWNKIEKRITEATFAVAFGMLLQR